MLTDSKKIIKLIENEIGILSNEINYIKDDVKVYEKLYKKLSNSRENIIDISKKELKELIFKFDIENKENLFKEILTVQKILKMNNDYSSTLRLFERNEKAFDSFMDELSKYDLESDFIKNKIEKLYSKQKEYEKLIQEIENDKFKVNRKNIELIEKIFLENNSLEDRKLIEEIMENEIENYNDRIKKSKRKEEKKLAEEDLIQVFNKYDYKYKTMDEKYRNYLEKHGDLNNIDEVFSALLENDYPKIIDEYVLTSILLGSNKSTIDTVTSFSREHRLIPKSLLDISGCLLEQRDEPKTFSDYDYMVTGSSIDFMRNIITIKSAGLSINYIFQKCRSILTMPNALLKYNIDLFNKYGFSFEYKKRGIIDPSPDALLSPTFAEICDAFIEISPNGLKYLTDNLSNVKTVTNPDALMFYNIYLSEKLSSVEKEDDPNNGPFRKVLEENNENYQLKAIITRNRPDYRNTPYEGITEENKREKTNTIEIPIKGKKKMTRIIEENKYPNISDSIFNNPYILSIDKYISEDSALVYDFSGIRISRLKVLRVYDTLLKNGISNSIDGFMYAIFYNTIIDEDGYEKVVRCIKKEVEVR